MLFNVWSAADDELYKGQITMAKALEEMNHHLECGICRDRLKQPKVLDCFHSFCQECLQDYYESRYKDTPEIPCPSCRHMTALPETRIQGLKTNFHLMGIIEEISVQEKVAHSESTKVSCELCEEENEATHRCLDCAQNVCPNCRKTHLRCVTTSNHTVATFEEIRQGKVTVKKSANEDQTRCQKHRGEVKRFYCETCLELICRDCTVVDHCKPNHHYVDSGEASIKYKQSLKDMLSDFDVDIKVLEQSLAASSQAKQKFAQSVTRTVKAVKKRADKLRAEIAIQEKMLIRGIKQIQQDRNRMYDKHQEKVSQLLQGKQHSVEVAKGVASTASDNDFLSLYPVINKDLKSLKGPTPPQIDSMLSYLSFTPGQTEINLGKLEEKVRKWEMCCKFDHTGGGLGGVMFTVGITGTVCGEIALVKYFNKKVLLCSSDGQVKEKIPVQSSPWDIAAIHNHDNQLVVVDDTKYVKVFNKKNELAFQFPTVPQSEVDKADMNFSSVAVKEDGTILVGDVNRMVWTEHRPTDGALLCTIPVQTPPCYLAVDDHTDRVVVSGGGSQKVDIASSNGTILATIKPSINGQQVQHCHGVCCDSSGTYIAVCNEPDTGHIHHYDLDGNFLACVVQGLHVPFGITSTPDRKLAVGDGHAVKMYHKV
ncbi:E3 ubiquitin-protein ligase TRIM56-like isoform X2 [Acanthaster planci]|uniref:E3 ubiquitin-protein ligase TRIM56-like isoform X2 n=1 Tax=Acanthaster planci TaxID=133434 RepID=A0A8B7Z7K5_ACAPL|nr:E3 ubiquitin-protein ligase TRIM56-like isoform X2 [Acanthaster planci]